MDFMSYFKKILMLEAMMTDWDAAQIFGFTDGNIPESGELRKIYLKKITAAHPDAGGSTEDAAKINAAYDLLKKRAGSKVGNYSSSSGFSGWNRSRSYSNSSSSSSSSSSNSNNQQSRANAHLQSICKLLVGYAEKFDTDLRTEFANKLGSIAKELDAKTGYNWKVKFLVKEKLAPQMRNGTAFSETYYKLFSYYILNAIHSTVIFENDDPDNSAKIYVNLKYTFNLTDFMKKWSTDSGMRSKKLFNGDFNVEGTVSFQNLSRLLKKEYAVSSKNKRGSTTVNQLKDFNTFFAVKKVPGFDSMLSKYFSKTQNASNANDAGYWSNASSSQQSTSSSSSYASDDSGDPLKKAVNLLYDNLNSEKARNFDRAIDSQFSTSLAKIITDFNKLTGYKWESHYYISDTLMGLIRLPSQIGRFLKKIPELSGSFNYDYYYPVDTLIDLVNQETKQVITIQTTYWFIIDKSNVGDRFKYGLGWRCYMNGQVSYEVNNHKFFYKFRSTEMITNPNPDKLANLFNLTALLRLGLGDEGSEAHMRDTLFRYYTKPDSADASKNSSSSSNANQANGSSYTKNSSTADASSSNKGATKSGLTKEEEDKIIAILKKNKFDTLFPNELRVKISEIAKELSAKTGYHYDATHIVVSPTLQSILAYNQVFDKCFKTDQGNIKIPLIFNVSVDFHSYAAKKHIFAEMEFTFYLSPSMKQKMFGYNCDIKNTITLPEISGSYSFKVSNGVKNDKFNILDSFNAFFDNNANGAGKKANLDDIIATKYSKQNDESASAQQSQAKSSTTGSSASSGASSSSTGFKDYVNLTDIANFVKTLNGYKLSKRTTGGVVYSSYALQIVAPKISPAEKKILDKEKFSSELARQAKKLNSIRLVVDYNEKDKTVVFKRFEKIVLNKKYNEPSIVSKEVKSKAVPISISVLEKLKTFFANNATATTADSLATKFNSLAF